MITILVIILVYQLLLAGGMWVYSLYKQPLTEKAKKNSMDFWILMAIFGLLIGLLC